MSFNGIHRTPFLRLLLPLATGIFCGDKLFFMGQSGWVASYFFPLLLLCTVCLFILFGWRRYSCRWLFGIFVFLFCFILGFGQVDRYLSQSSHVYLKKEVPYCAVIIEQPEIKEKSVLCRVLLTEQKDAVAKDSLLQCKALLYLTMDSLSKSLHNGDELLVFTRITPPENSKNPDEFDYARFLARRQVSGIGFVYADNWRLISHHDYRSFRQEAVDCREYILSLYRRLGFQGDDFAVLAALTVGYKEELSEDIRETYSVSGASHVLALSGLHIGFLYALLWFCLRWLPQKWRWTRLLRTLLIILLLWTFAFFTGLSASVVRSVIMFSLFALSNLFERKNSSLNTLLAAAFFMLLFQPSWLFDVGFQLSFCAVVAILLIQPGLYRLLPVKHRVWKYIWGLITVSVAAQIGTAPLVLLYFSRFSTHFLLTNLLVIPLVSVIMYTAVLMLLLTPFPVIQSVVAIVVKTLIGMLNSCVHWVEQLPGASIDNVWVYQLEVVGFYLLLFFLMRYLALHTSKNLIACLCCLLFVCTYHIVLLMNDRPRQSIVFYNVRNCPVAHCIAADGQSWLFYADSVPNEARLRRTVSAYWNRLHLELPRAVTTDSDEDPFLFHNHILSFSGHRLCMVNDNRWWNKTTSRPLYIDYLYICKGYDGRLEWLMQLFAVRNVILDASLSEYRRVGYEEECRRMGLRFISLSEKGSVRFLL